MSDKFIKISLIILAVTLWIFIIYAILSFVKISDKSLENEQPVIIEQQLGAILSVEDQNNLNLMDKVINKQQLTMDEYKKVVALYDIEILTNRNLLNISGDMTNVLAQKVKTKITNKYK